MGGKHAVLPLYSPESSLPFQANQQPPHPAIFQMFSCFRRIIQETFMAPMLSMSTIAKNTYRPFSSFCPSGKVLFTLVRLIWLFPLLEEPNRNYKQFSFPIPTGCQFRIIQIPLPKMFRANLINFPSPSGIRYNWGEIPHLSDLPQGAPPLKCELDLPHATAHGFTGCNFPITRQADWCPRQKAIVALSMTRQQAVTVFFISFCLSNTNNFADWEGHPRSCCQGLAVCRVGKLFGRKQLSMTAKLKTAQLLQSPWGKTCSLPTCLYVFALSA